MLLAAYTGARRGEVLGIRRSEIQFEGTPGIMINRQIKKAKGGKELNRLKTEGSERFIPVPGRIMDMIKAHIAKQPTIKRTVKGKEVEQEPELLFCHDNGEAYYPDTLTRKAKAVTEKIGIQTLTPHALRHTFATLLIEAGESDRVIAELMGHASLAMLKRYAHVKNKLKTSAINRLENHIDGD